MPKSNTAKRIKSAAPIYPIPQDRDAVVEAIAEIGRQQRERDRIQAAMNDELAAVRQRWEEEAAPHADAIKLLSQGVQHWCDANRESLTKGGKVKFCQLASGEIKWRMRPPSARITGMAAVIQTLRRMGLDRFIRTKEDVNKEAILNEPEAVEGVAGIRIVQSEDFVIVPFETELEEVA